ncbi:amino acid kinase family protein [Lignipirellula cremea]|uniref:Amino acid kinase family protein n=1 Tax=Lignipirellula cremea TaxID=2528010 RepID=A0A518DWC0_9BACT|nr:hypothetical protein [Lignipirellula cremea]QDU96128.1 hypothetical protein Pla8534_39470 [Lignipirellula cremea]
MTPDARPQSPLRVVKVGGSLLAAAKLGPRLASWLRTLPGSTVLIAGGGQLADAIRFYDERQALGQAVSHALCIGLLSTSAQVLRALLPELPQLTESADLRFLGESGRSQAVIFDPCRWLQTEEPHQPPRPLPCDWRVTSDSIAARLAGVLDADACWLLKATPPPGERASLQELADRGYVDAWLPQLTSIPPVHCLALPGPLRDR